MWPGTILLEQNIAFLLQEWQQKGLNNILNVHGTVQNSFYKKAKVTESCNIWYPNKMRAGVEPVSCGRNHSERFRCTRLFTQTNNHHFLESINCSHITLNIK